MKHLWLIAALLTGCHMTKFSLDVQSARTLEVPSASGIVHATDRLFVIGDNTPYLLTLDDTYQVIDQMAIFSTDHLKDGILPKKYKPDFEAMELVADELLIFGSGSRAQERNYLIRVRPSEGQIVTHDLSEFYASIKAMDIMRGSELNIEAVAYFDNTLYLFNRSNNVILLFDYAKFKNHLNGEIPFPTPKTVQVALPELSGKMAGFSGATIGLPTPHLLFTATVEHTENAYDDGAIGGSFLGIVDLRRLGDKDAYQFMAIEHGEASLKVESVTIDRIISKREVSLLMTTDSDGGESLLLKGRLGW